MPGGRVPSLGAGINAVPRDDAAVELRLTAVGPGLADTAALADYALGGALRRQLGAGQRLPTVTLTLELDGERASGATAVCAWAEPVRGDLGRAHGVVLDGGDEQIGQCSATFAVLPHPTDLEPLPWETSTGDASVEAADLRSAETIVGQACSVTGDTTTLVPDGAMLNRSGLLQGASLFRLAAFFPRQSTHLVSGHVQFLKPGDAGAPVTATPLVLAETRRMLFVQSLVRQRGIVVTAGSFVFRKGDA